MKQYFHYTLETAVKNILKTGLSSNVDYYTTDECYNAAEAGHKLGVRAHYIDCVLRFEDDGLFKASKPPIVPSTGRFTGGGLQFLHPMKKKPCAIRKITERSWRKI